MNVLSLFDGMSCGHLALQKATVQLGDVTQVKGADLPQIDLLIGGSPCQGFSFAGKGLNFDDPRSKLFFEFVRLKNECNPKYFLLENVKMKKEHELVISNYLGVAPIEINSSLLSAQNRVRLYWTNIAQKPYGLFGDMMCSIEQPKDKGVLLRDILEQEVHERYYISEAALARVLRTGWSHPKFNPDKTMAILPKNNSGQLSVDSGTTLIDAIRGRNPENPKSREAGLPTEQMLELNNSGKTNCLTTVSKDNVVIEGGDFRGDEGFRWRKNEKSPTFQSRAESGDIYNSPLVKMTGEVKQLLLNKSPDFHREHTSHKSYALDTQNKHGIVVPHQQDAVQHPDDKAAVLVAGTHGSAPHHTKTLIGERIRRLTEIECERLQTVPDNYTNHVSSSQRYRMLGNGWTIDVIAYIFGFLKKELK